MSRRVVVTGMGMISGLGNSVEESWTNIVAGKSGVKPISRFDTTNYAVKIAAEAQQFIAEDYIDPKIVRRTDPYQHFIIVASREATQQSGFDTLTAEQKRKTAVIVGSAVGGMATYYDYIMVLTETNNPRKVTPFGITMVIPDGGSNIVSVELGAGGPSCTPVSACATGADCIGLAFDLIRAGRIDRALAGAGEYPIIQMGIAVFDRAGACTREMIQPFDKNRTGMVFGEGAGVIAIEELESAKARGATILAELVGYGSSSDGVHITAPDPEAIGATEAMTYALEGGQINPDQVDYINAHGTGTVLNDKMETYAVKKVLGQHAYNIPMSSTKSMTGHAMGATAAMEAIFSIQSILDNVAPPTINYETPDPDCDLDIVPNHAKETKIDVALSNSFGFGGHNATLIFKRFDG
ncbi:beta-ketoacyl-ACP synthase II [Anaerolineales bacterium]